MTRVSLPALAGAAVVAGGFFAASIPAQARCVGIAACAQPPAGIAARPGFAANRPGIVNPGIARGNNLVGAGAGNLVGAGAGNLVGAGAGNFRPR